MRRVTIVVPGLVGPPDCESALRPLPSALQRVVEGATVVKLRPLPASATPEAAYLALNPEDIQVAQGPLTVAALGYRPPERSVHFHATLCSVDDDGVLGSALDAREHPVVLDSELDQVFRTVERLNTKFLIPLRGEGLDHALVWEGGSTDLETMPPSEALGHSLFSVLPGGEGEEMLRRFVDDTVNLLSTHEINHVRRGEGLPALNCFWPWGQGFRPELPNLPLRRGDVAHVVSGSMRLAGLCRMVGYAHGHRHAFGTKLQTDYDLVRENATAHRISLAVIHSVEEMRRHGRVDEIVWNLERLSSRVVGPLLDSESPFELRLAAPCGEIGLGLTYLSERRVENGLPFDERVMDDVRVPVTNVWEFLQGGFVGEVAS